MAHRWNLSRWMDQLGLKRQDQPELIHGVQPVTILGDHSAFTAPIIPALGFAGAARGAVAGAYGGLQLQSAAPGGTFIRDIRFAGASANDVGFRIVSGAVTAMGNLSTITVYEMGPGLVSTPRIGTFASTPSSAMLAMGNGEKLIWIDTFYVPPGDRFEIWTTTANLRITASIVWEDCLAQPVSA